MAIFYNKIQRINPSDKSKPALWYAVLKSVGMVKEKQVAREIADETTLNPKEAELAIGQLPKVVINNLLAANTVQLGDLGSFRLTAESEGSATEAEVSASNIKNLNVRFTASESLKEALKKATIKDASSLSSK